MSSGKRKSLTVSDKMQVVRALREGLSNSDVCERFGLSTSTVSTIWKNRDALVHAFVENKMQVKKLRTCEKSDLDSALLMWYKVKSSEGARINGPILKAQAETLATGLGYKGFVCSKGWLERFKNRHQIVYTRRNGDGSCVDVLVSHKRSISVN